MNYVIKKFEDLTTNELYEILRVRAEVFVVEQDCVYQDLDLKDQKSYHLYCEENGEIVSYLRVIPCGISHSEVSIGRVLTREEYRKKGISRELMNRAIAFITEELGEREIRISAQAYLLGFYSSLGFTQVSDIYLEDGIEHAEMLYRKEEK